MLLKQLLTELKDNISSLQYKIFYLEILLLIFYFLMFYLFKKTKNA